jgi:hypothetical protein
VDLNGHEHTIQLAIEGWWIGDLQSFILQQPALLNVEAMEDSLILEIPNEKFLSLYEKVPKFERYFRIITQRSICFLSAAHVAEPEHERRGAVPDFSGPVSQAGVAPAPEADCFLPGRISRVAQQAQEANLLQAASIGL